MSGQSNVNALHQDIEVIGLVGLAHGSSHFFQLLLPTLFPWLMADFGLSFTQVGLLTTLCFGVSAIGQAPGGFVVDAWGPHRVLLLAITTFILAATLVATAPGYLQLCFAAILVGLGNSVFHPADFTLLNRRVSTARLGHAFSVHGLSGNLGWALAPVLLAAVAAASGWRAAAWVACCVALLPWTTFLLRRRVLKLKSTNGSASPERDESSANASLASSSPSPDERQHRKILREQFGFLSSSGVWMSFCFFLIVSTAFGGMQNFAPSVFIQLYGLSAPKGAWMLSVFLVSGGVGMVAGGFMVARTAANEKTVAIVLGVAAFCLLLLSSGAIHPNLCVLLMFVAGFATGIAGPARDMLVRQSAITKFGQQSLGRIYGLVYSGLDVGIALSPLIFGVLLDVELAAGVLVLVSCFYVAGGIIALKMGRMKLQPPSAERAC